MINVLLDTNILHNEGLFSHNMQILGRLASERKIEIYLPELVKREFISRRASEALSKLQSVHTGLNEVLKRIDRKNLVHINIGALQTSLNTAGTEIENAIMKDFEDWQNSHKVNLLPLDSAATHTVFDEYFSGTGVFRKPKHRDDIPDAFINTSIQSLLKEKLELNVVIKDGAFRQHLAKTSGVLLFEDLDSFLNTPKIIECINQLDAQSARTESLKQLFCSTPFKANLFEFLKTAHDQVSDVYLEDEDISQKEVIGLNSAFGFRINYPVADKISNFQIHSASQINDGLFSLGISFKTVASIDYCGYLPELLNLPEKRRAEIEEMSMNSEGISDLSELRHVELHGHLALQFDPNFSVETLKALSQYLDTQKSSIAVELEIIKAEIL